MSRQSLSSVKRLLLSSIFSYLLVTCAFTVASRADELGVANGVVCKHIVIDAGHGGPDSGARGVNDLYEKHITLQVAQYLAAYLRQAGAVVTMTRDSDRDLATPADRVRKHRHLGDLQGRLRVVRQKGTDAFVSVHCNAVTSTSWSGAQVLFLQGNAKAETLAKMMQQSFSTVALPTKRSVQANKSLYLLKRVPGPAVLAEIGFITNPEEARYLKTNQYQRQVAFAMYVALQQYFSAPVTNAE